MTNDQKIRLRLSQVRGRLNDIAGIEDLTDEIRSEAEALHTELNDLSIRERALIPSEGITENRDTGLDAEARERNELRSRARVTSYILAALSGRQVDGAEAELRGRGRGFRRPPRTVGHGPGRKRGDAARRCDGSAGYRGREPGRHPAAGLLRQYRPTARDRNAPRRIRVLRPRRRSARA